MASSITEKPRLYDLMHETYAVDDRGGIPDQATLDEIETALHGAIEFLIDPAALAIVRVAVEGKANTITYEEIGRLVLFADHIHDHATSIAEAAAKVSVAARESYGLAEGYDDPHDGLFSEYGNVVDREWFERLTRRFVDAH